MLVELSYCYLQQKSTEKKISELQKDSSSLTSNESEFLQGVKSIQSFLHRAVNKLLTEEYDDSTISPFVLYNYYNLSVKAQTDEGVF